MPDTGTGLQRQVGPLKAWQWIAAVAALAIGYWLYKRYQSNQANTASTTTGTDTTGIIDPTTGQPYATESGTAYDPYGYGYQSLQSQLTAMLYDPTTGQPYYQEFAANQATQTTANTTIENALATLTAQIQDFESHTQTVPSPSPLGGSTPGGGGSGGAGNNTVVPDTGLPSGTGGNNTSTTVSGVVGTYPNFAGPPSTVLTGVTTPASSPMLSNLPIAQQIQMVINGTANKSQLGPNALKIYNAGGISTALPNRAAVQQARNLGLNAGAPLGVH